MYDMKLKYLFQKKLSNGKGMLSGDCWDDQGFELNKSSNIEKVFINLFLQIIYLIFPKKTIPITQVYIPWIIFEQN